MYVLTTQPYYLQNLENYINIIRINMIPEGPLKLWVRRLPNKKLGIGFNKFNQNNIDNNSCIYALINITTNRWLTPNDIPELFSFLSFNNYNINTSITKMMNNSDVRLSNENIICFFSYNYLKNNNL